MEQTGLHTIDYVIVGVYLVILIAVGTSFSRKEKTGDKFFLGSGKFPSWAVGLSLMATLISSVTFLAYPQEGFAHNWLRLLRVLMVPFVLVFMISAIVAIYRKVIGVSIYEYFEQRFGYGARLYTSLAFLFSHFTKMATIFFLLSLAIADMLGLSIFIVIWVLGIIVIINALVGGFEAVIWLDVIQGFLLIAGGIICVWFLLTLPQMGPVAIIKNAIHQGKISFAPYQWNFTHLTFAVMALNGIFYGIQKYATDQTMVQRYLVAGSDKEAVRASLMGIFLSVLVWVLFMFIGTALWSYYTVSGHFLPAGIHSDSVFPYFIKTALPNGVAGIILAGLISAAFSSLNSDLNSLSAVCTEDYYKRLKPNSNDKQQLIVSRLVVGIGGLAAVGLGTLYLHIGNQTIFSILITLYSIFAGGMAGLFLLAIATTRANKKGTYVGIWACIIFTGYAVLTSVSVPIGGEDRILLDLGRFNFPQQIYMIGVYNHVILFVVGYIASFFFSHEKEIKDLTIYPWLRERKNSKQKAVEEHSAI